MLTSLYSIIAILKSLLFGDSGSLSDWYRQRSLLLGILGRLAQAKRIPLSVPEVAKLFGVTPKTVYKNIKRNEALAAKIQEMLKALAGCILVPRRNVDKTILSLALDARAPLEGIQRVLAYVYDGKAPQSIGYISSLLKRAGAFAEEILNTISLRGITQGANDEIFDSSNSPVLTGIDLDSTYIYLMQDMYDRKGETWEFVMETLKDKGLELTVSISDAGSGLLKGIKAAFPKADIQIDVFHVFRDFGRAVSHFKKHVLKKVTDCYDLEKTVSKEKSWHAGYKEQKKQLKESQAKIPALVDDYDTLTILYSWTHELLSFSGYNPDEVKELMRWLLEEMNALASRNSWAFELRRELSRFEERLPATMRFLDRLFAAFNRAARDIGLPEEAFRLLYRRSAVPKDSETYLELTRQALAVTGPERFGAVEKTHDRILGSIKRASSMIENVNNRLRPYMDIKKHVSSQFYSLIQLYLNTKKYRRSRIESRVGRSPVEILTGKQWPEFIELLDERGFWAEQTAKEVA